MFYRDPNYPKCGFTCGQILINLHNTCIAQFHMTKSCLPYRIGYDLLGILTGEGRTRQVHNLPQIKANCAGMSFEPRGGNFGLGSVLDVFKAIKGVSMINAPVESSNRRLSMPMERAHYYILDLDNDRFDTVLSSYYPLHPNTVAALQAQNIVVDELEPDLYQYHGLISSLDLTQSIGPRTVYMEQCAQIIRDMANPDRYLKPYRFLDELPVTTQRLTATIPTLDVPAADLDLPEAAVSGDADDAMPRVTVTQSTPVVDVMGQNTMMTDLNADPWMAEAA